MKRMLKIAVLLLIPAILAAAVIIKINAKNEQQERQRPTPPVKLEKPVRETVYYKLQFNGNVSAILQAHIFSKINGNLEQVYADIGTYVKKNKLLAIIDSTELYQKVQETEAIFYNARVNYNRTRQLLEQEILAKEDLDNAEATLKIARANYESAKIRLSYAFITAPFSGYVTRRFLDPGALISPNNTTLFTIMDINTVKIVVNVLERDIALIPKVKRAIITVDAFPGKEFYGMISRSSQAIDLDTRTMMVEIEIPNKDNVLKPGMFATVTLIIEERPDALTLPVQAIMKDNQGSYVFAVDSNVVKRIAVTIGSEQNSRMEILFGLLGAENIVISGQQFLRPGSSVLIQE